MSHCPAAIGQMINSPVCGRLRRSWKKTLKIRLALCLTLASLALCACLGNSGSPASAPGNVRLYQGDGTISVSWNDNPSLIYWVFFAQDPTLSTDNWSGLLNAGAYIDTGSPAIVCGEINNPNPSPLFPQIYFTVDARTGSAPGGAGSPVVGTSPRPAGGPLSPWVAGASIPGQVLALGYAPITSCGYGGRPPSGMFVAVGSSGTIYSSTLAPNVAGPLVLSQGNTPMSWNQANVPAGLHEDLTGVAGLSTVNNPGAPNFVFVAVGKGGTILRSTDGLNWQQVGSIPTSSNLNAISVAGATFVAVGDGGVVLLSADGLNWRVSTGAATASTNTLNAIRCVGASCVAVGAQGTTLWTGDGGNTWTLYIHGNNNWTGIAYGNDNANADAVVTAVNGTLSVNTANEAINTWVVTDALGNFAYAPSAGVWISNATTIASSIVAIEYTTHFVALDSAGNAYASENGASWQPVGTSNVLNPVAMRSNGIGFVAVGASGTNASSF